jgi:hypothetical protein
MSPPLGDSFPTNVREDFAKKHIKPGSVIFCLFNGTKEKKEKRFLVLGVSTDTERVGIVIFNTNKPFKGNKNLESLQHHFKADGRLYLDNDCFLNCAHLEIISYKVLHAEIVKYPEHYLESLSQKEFDEICTIVANANTVSPKNVKEFGLTSYLLKE